MIHDDHTPNLFLPADDRPATPDIDAPSTELEMADGLHLANGQPETLFRLLNIHLVDSLSRGRIQTMSIDGGTALTGRNGQGKTSLLSLALIFAGVEPKDVVSQGKDSFIDYYLPNQTSFIVYEYERPDGSRRLVVAYSNSTAERVYFRFVKSGFLREMFVTDDGQFVLAKEFRMRLVQLKIPHADKQVETYVDFRSIIQYWQPHGAESKHRRYLLGMSADYAFTSYNRPLRHLEKLTKGMFSRKANFDDLQQVVADWVFDKQSMGIQTERGLVENWPRDYSAYQNIMGIRPLVNEAIEVRLNLENAEDGMRELKEKFLLLKEHLEVTKAQRESQRDSLEQFLQGRKDEYDQAYSALLADIQAAKADIHQCENTLQSIEDARLKMLGQDVERKRAEYSQREMFAAELHRIEKRHDLVLGAATHIKAKYDQEINAENSRHNDFRTAVAQESAALRHREREEQVAADQRQQDARRTYQEASSAEREALQRAIQEVTQQMGRDQERVNNPVIDPALGEALENKTEQLDQAEAVVALHDKAVRQQESTVSDLQAQSSALDQEITRIKQAASKQLSVIEGIKRAHAPEPDSLLQFLRSNRPDWSDNIAKVINPGLLHRTDLHPQLATISDSLYGIALDLEYVDPVDEADESKLQALLAEAHEELAAIEGQLERASERQKDLRQTHKVAQDELGIARSKLSKARSVKQVIDAEISTLKRDLRKNRDEAMLIAQDTLAETRRKLNLSQQAYDAFARRLASDQDKLDERAKAEKAAISSRYQQAEADLNGKIHAHAQATDLSIRSLKADLNRKLTEEGADVQVIGELEEQMRELKAKLVEIDSWRDLLNKWQHWLEYSEPEKPILATRIEQANTLMTGKKLELEKTTEAWSRTKTDIGATINECRDAINGCVENSLIVDNALKEVLAPFTATKRFEAYEEVWQAEILRASMGGVQARLREADKELRTKVSKMRGAFVTTPLAPPATYFQDRVANLREESSGEVDTRMMLQVIEDWFANHHDKSRRLLIADGRTIFGEIQGLHRELKSFSEKITRFNTGLQEHLTHSSQVFDSITNLKVSIFSSVEELDYWKIISKITDDREQWLTEDTLPNQQAVENLLALLSHWDIKSGINANFKSLVSIRGSVEEKNNLRQFRNRSELENVSSNGLSYLILIILFLGFISKVRGNAPVQLTWCVDELKAIDAENVISLCNYLGQNRITLCTAFPDPDAETLILFENKYKLDAERRLVECKLVATSDADVDVEGDYDLDLESA
ncbi:ATP-binding protein [Pseudomonas sp. S1(2024)]|uniref:ATP-binding protein n=1 Tax=Pseudomonas sp. S1(2024) TaxID=3390191 RepID=UPI00397BD92E